MQITHKRQESSGIHTEKKREREKEPAATRACHLMSQLKFNTKLIPTHAHSPTHTLAANPHTVTSPHTDTKTGACCTLCT